MSSFKFNFILGTLKAIRKTAEHFVANFPLDSREKKVKLIIKLTKQKQPIKRSYI